MSVSHSPVSVKVLTVMWFIILSFFWLWFKYNEADEVYKTETAKLATQWVGAQLSNSNKPSEKKAEVIAEGYVALILVLPVAWVAAVMHAVSMGSEAKKRAEALKKADDDVEQAKMNLEMAQMEYDNVIRAGVEKRAQFQQEVIMRLGSIDQFIRVLAMETDASRRTVALQAAQSEMTTLTAKVASDSDYISVVFHQNIRELAAETSNDLVRLGLADDRLNRDIIRVFHLHLPVIRSNGTVTFPSSGGEPLALP